MKQTCEGTRKIDMKLNKATRLMKKEYIVPNTTLIPWTPASLLAASDGTIPVVPEDGSGNVVENSGGAWSTGRNKTEHPIWH